MKNIKYTVLFGLLVIVGSGCQKYLDAKPDKQLATPTGLADLQAVLDSHIRNTIFPAAADIASDDYFLTDDNWASLYLLNARQDYNWNPIAANDFDYQYGYQDIETANVVLDGLSGFTQNAANAAAFANAKGSALFFRAYTYEQLVNIFTLPYDAGTSETLPGLPLRLSSDITIKTTRATIAATDAQIIADLQQAVALLPNLPLVPTRPSKAAAYGALARIFLITGNYGGAKLYADSCLSLHPGLIDYNTLDTSSSAPFDRFNVEVIFHATSSGRGGALNPARAWVDTNLYSTYANNDLRKYLFFQAISGGYHAFKGDYSGQNYGQPFGGLATDELMLIRAECNARLGDAKDAVSDINQLLTSRFKTGTYLPAEASIGVENVLSMIINERRKELAFRSAIRWSDLRRYSSDSRFSVTPKRFLNGQLYQLPPGDKRYAFLLPVGVLQSSGIEQNTR